MPNLQQILILVLGVPGVAYQASSSCAASGSSCDAHGVHGDILSLPQCEQDFDFSDLIDQAKTFCNPALVPDDKRVPKKVAGLYWLKGLPLPDVAACFSTGDWNPNTLTLTLSAWKDFLFMNGFEGRSVASQLYKADLAYLVKFKDASLSAADITPTTTGYSFAYSRITSAFGAIAAFPLIEISDARTPGSRYARPSYFGAADAKALTNEYEAWKILDGDLKPVTENVEMMMKLLLHNVRQHKTIRFFEGPCNKGVEAAATVMSCQNGAFLEVLHQPQLGLLRVAPAPVFRMKFAHVTTADCSAEYALVCRGGSFAVEEEHFCSAGKRYDGIHGGTLQHSWEICAQRHQRLNLLEPVIDVTWNVKMPLDAEIEGCIRVSLPDDHPELASIRGTWDEQLHAIINRKKHVGGCPTFRTASDRLQRANDFEGSGITGALSRSYLKLLQKEHGMRASVWSHALPFSDNESLADSSTHVASLATTIPYFSNRTLSFTTYCMLNCGEASPFVDSPMVFHYDEVSKKITEPKLGRGYAMWGTPQTEACFHRSLLLFQDSGSPEHTQWRLLLDEAGFDNMHKRNLTNASSLLDSAWTQKIRKIIGLKSILPHPGELEVGKIVLPLVFEGVWGKPMSSSVALTILPYLEFGKLCIFGKRGQNMGLVHSWAVAKARNAAIQHVKDSPLAKTLLKLIEAPGYATVKKLLLSSGEPLSDLLLRNVVDASLFAGFVGTTDMSNKCVRYQFNDPQHVLMFRRGPSAYLHELMRMDPAVGTSTYTLDKDETWNVEGYKINFKKGQPMVSTLITANRDPSTFSNPNTFDSDRTELDDILSWNGKLRDVVARNYSAAPRFCPGYHLSVKVAADVCFQMTKDLNPWGTAAQDKGEIKGLVKVLAQGPHKGKLAFVSYFDFYKQQHCLSEKDHHDSYLGCFPDEELEVISANGGRPKTLDEEYNMCPKLVPQMMHMVAKAYTSSVESQSTVGWAIERLLGKRPETEMFTEDWADDYTILMYTGINLIAMPLYAARHSDSAFLPRRTGHVEDFRVGTVAAPDVDIDHPHFTPVEWYIPQPLFDFGFLPGVTCFHGYIRQLPWDDKLQGDEQNTWELVLNRSKFKHRRKVDWVMSFYNGYKTHDGTQNWPALEVDFAKLYLLKDDTWDDRLEKAIAFGLIASHRVEAVQPPIVFGGESLSFVLKLNQFAGLKVRKYMGKFEGDLYFTGDGMPAMMELADGTRVAKGDKEWQYRKFAWRCALITVITLTDHLHMTHFRAANVLAKVSRETLSPDHPLRRLLTVFTFGSIFINLQAMHTLIGPRHVLHRSSPFEDFEGLSEIVPETMLSLTDEHKVLLKEEEWEKLPGKLQEAPYYADGKLLFEAERKLIREWFKIYASGKGGICNAEDVLVAPEAKKFHQEMLREASSAHYHTSITENSTCSELCDILLAYIWTVTGWHRHVGTVGDYYKDPELASFSWKEGESFARPLQHMQMSTIAVFTSAPQPKLIEDYSHVFKGVYKEEEMLQALESFRADLHKVSDEIGKRNEMRLTSPEMGFKNVHADPKIVECSVAV